MMSAHHRYLECSGNISNQAPKDLPHDSRISSHGENDIDIFVNHSISSFHSSVAKAEAEMPHLFLNDKDKQNKSIKQTNSIHPII